MALLGLLDALSPGHEQHLGAGRDEGVVRPRCPATVIPRLDAPARADTGLDPLLARRRPDLVHVHNVVNPQAAPTNCPNAPATSTPPTMLIPVDRGVNTRTCGLVQDPKSAERRGSEEAPGLRRRRRQ